MLPSAPDMTDTLLFLQVTRSSSRKCSYMKIGVRRQASGSLSLARRRGRGRLGGHPHIDSKIATFTRLTRPRANNKMCSFISSNFLPTRCPGTKVSRSRRYSSTRISTGQLSCGIEEGDAGQLTCPNQTRQTKSSPNSPRARQGIGSS
jgi:hypothetical protein